GATKIVHRKDGLFSWLLGSLDTDQRLGSEAAESRWYGVASAAKESTQYFLLLNKRRSEQRERYPAADDI
nr:hypothetical protein [Candidatus Saccharimonas sp.]